ncbi:unnamed protein product [Sphenostylis stenocarpa]|uniref:Uncharacterized protein n=1 Tax=Sphenostylis stenocarpa TaxID=92480 RepID=A0AA86SQT8_9FABA|nr:unnamed protein product [Sphenostylis stenocarpa]
MDFSCGLMLGSKGEEVLGNSTRDSFELKSSGSSFSNGQHTYNNDNGCEDVGNVATQLMVE